jgi:hypothetical protein
MGNAVQTAFNDTPALGTTQTVTFGSTQTVGNLNIVAIWLAPSTGVSITSVKDTNGNGPSGSYKLAYHLADGGTTDGDLWLYYAWDIAAASAGANTVTATCSPTGSFNADVIVAILEEPGVKSSSDPLRIANGTIENGSVSTPTVSLTGTQSSDLIVGFSTSDSGQSTAGSPLVAEVAQNFTVLQDGFLAGGTVNVTSGPNDSLWNILAAAFEAIPGFSDIIPMIGGGRDRRNSVLFKM